MISKENKNLIKWLGIVLAVAILLRVTLFLTYPAVSYSDTPSYRRSAEAVLGGFQFYDGTRTPGYPAFIAFIGPDRAVYGVQLLLGMLVTMGWFGIGWKATGKPFFGAVAALAHTLNPGQFFFEANLLTETLATFWLMLSLLGAFLWLDNPKYRSLWLALGIGLSGALATLTRPLFIFVPLWLVLFLAFSFEGKKWRFNWQPVVGVLLPAILLVGGWMLWIRSNYQVFSLTTMTGYHLVQHTGYYFEAVPDEHAELRDIYLTYRQARMDTHGTQGNTIWDAIPAMQEATGMHFYELSRTLQSISIQLILNHPWEYLSRVVRGWWLFWRAPVYWDQAAISSPGLASAIRSIILSARGLLFVMNLVFIFTSIAALVSSKLRISWRINAFHWLVAGAIWATSILSSVLDHGDNPRFLVPMQSWVVFWVLWIGYATWRERRQAVIPRER